LIFTSLKSDVNLQLNPSVQSNYDRVNQVARTFFTSPGPGTRCMKGHQIKISKSSSPLECNNFDAQLISNYTMPSRDTVAQLNANNFSYTKFSPDCDCSSGFPVCGNGAGGDIPNRPISILKTTDYMYDLSGRNVTDWLIKTELSKTFFKKRYGGFEFLAPSSNLTQSKNSSNITDFLLSYTLFAQNFVNLINIFSLNQNLTSSPVDYLNGTRIVGTNPLYSDENVKIWYNTKGYDASVSYLNILNNAFLRNNVNLEGKDPNSYGKNIIKYIKISFWWP
jgi:hypothetical protein